MKQINLINILGLLADITGVIILFVHAPPIEQQLSRKTMDELEKFGFNQFMRLERMSFERIQRSHKKWASIGIKIILVGFALQVLASFSYFIYSINANWNC